MDLKKFFLAGLAIITVNSFALTTIHSFTVANSIETTAIHSYNFNKNNKKTLFDKASSANGKIIDAAWESKGHKGSALSFNGKTSKVYIGTKAALDGTTDFTVSAWIKTSSNKRGVIVQQLGKYHNGQYSLLVKPDGKLYFSVFYSAYQFQISSSTNVNDGKWHHVAAVREGLTGRVYIDGVEVGSETGSKIQALGKHVEVAIGADIRSNNSYFKGIIDEVEIYDKALSSRDISKMIK